MDVSILALAEKLEANGSLKLEPQDKKILSAKLATLLIEVPEEKGASAKTVMDAQKFINGMKRGNIIHPSIKEGALKNISCLVAWIHYRIINSVRPGLTAPTLLKNIGFELSLNEKKGAKEYLNYFEKVERDRDNIIDKEVFKLAKKLREISRE